MLPCVDRAFDSLFRLIRIRNSPEAIESYTWLKNKTQLIDTHRVEFLRRLRYAAYRDNTSIKVCNEIFGADMITSIDDAFMERMIIALSMSQKLWSSRQGRFVVEILTRKKVQNSAPTVSSVADSLDGARRLIPLISESVYKSVIDDFDWLFITNNNMNDILSLLWGLSFRGDTAYEADRYRDILCGNIDSDSRLLSALGLQRISSYQYRSAIAMCVSWSLLGVWGQISWDGIQFANDKEENPDYWNKGWPNDYGSVDIVPINDGLTLINDQRFSDNDLGYICMSLMAHTYGRINASDVVQLPCKLHM
jgi:hypothetical protein